VEFLFAGRRDGKRVLIVSDSMLRGVRVGSQFDIELVIRGGAKIRDISSNIYLTGNWNGFRNVQVVSYKFIVVHVGTNDVANGRSFAEIALDIRELVGVIRRFNRNAIVLVSGVLFRPLDDRVTFRKVIEANAAMRGVCEGLPSVLFMRTYTLFKSGSTLLTQLYDRFGLHLNRDGLERVGRYLRARLARGSLKRDFALAHKTVPMMLR